ncbi:MAG: ATP-dependent DNA helicase [Gammaproteobacteria bacterium]
MPAPAEAGRRASALLGPDSALAAALDGFSVRAEQQAMAAEVAATMAARDVLVCEAGTGTGKTFAYLVPALDSGLKSVLSTATKTLQDQLYQRDLPLVERALGQTSRTALLKGRQNYLCLYRLDRARADIGADYRHLPLLEHLADWAAKSDGGDLEEVSLLDDDAGLRHQVTSTAENCLGQACPAYERCFVARARRRAAEADVVVVNHHLLFADMVLRETGFAELLPEAEAVVLDEAHKLPDIAAMFFSRSVSAQQLATLARDAAEAAAREAGDMPDLNGALLALDRAQRDLHIALGDCGKRPNWAPLRQRPDIAERLATTGAALATVEAALELAADRGAELELCHQRALALGERWTAFEGEAADEHVHWVDIGARNFTLYDTPISVAEDFSARVEGSGAAWILTSATLAVDDSFEHFTRALGLKHARTHCWASPFDFAHQSLLYVPPMTAEPRAPTFERELLERVLPVLEASGGRAFFLFTSYRSLDRVADLLRARGGFSLFVQGDAPRSELLRRFRAAPRAVLLGTASFWEGVDVRGESLSLVIIDKLPFGVPDDPVMQARSRAVAERGGNPFMELQLPEAVTALKQGAGRLIRDTGDRGVLVIGDRRILRRGYGQSFLDSLPPMPLTTELADVEAFFAAAPAASAE